MSAPEANPDGYRILLLDDDPDVLDVYQEMLRQLPSTPEVDTAASGARALALLEAKHYDLLISDLRMPKMDGLQVLAIVRRKFPALRTIVLTGVTDETFRSRAYAMGIDLYLEKPNTTKEVGFFMDCIESLLTKEPAQGFRGVQSKGLVDLVQLECLSGSSSVLRISNGKVEGQIWIYNGEVIDAQTQELSGEEAFKRILGWKNGSFEIFPSEPARLRKIHSSYQGLLLDSVQALDEAQAAKPADSSTPGKASSRIAGLMKLPGVQFVIELKRTGEPEHLGLENPELALTWLRSVLQTFNVIGERCRFGNLVSVQSKAHDLHLSIVEIPSGHLVLGLAHQLDKEQIDQTLKLALERLNS